MPHDSSLQWLSGWMTGFRSAVFHHPLWSMLFLAVAIVGVIFGLKRILVDDTRNVSVYNNSKSGGRLD